MLCFILKIVPSAYVNLVLFKHAHNLFHSVKIGHIAVYYSFISESAFTAVVSAIFEASISKS